MPLRILEMRETNVLDGVKFHYLVKAQFPQKNLVKKTINKIFKDHGKKIEKINYIFCTDEYLLKINRNHLNHDYYTDIITFDLSDNRAATAADIYISVERVKENARKLRVTYPDEQMRVIFHGALHLCGFKDKSKTEKNKMRRMEGDYIQVFRKYSVSRGTIFGRTKK